MDSNTIPVNENTTVIVKSSGDLYVRGEGEGEVRFQSGEDRIRVNQSNDKLYVETHASLDLEVPRNASLIVEKVGGSALLQDLTGPLTVQKVGGDLGVQRTAVVRIEKVGGSCLIDGVADSLWVGKVGGDLTVRQVMGPIEIGTVGASIDLQVLGEALSARCGANMRVYVTGGLLGSMNLRAGAGVNVYLPAKTSGRFVLTSGGEHIKLDLTRQESPVDTIVDERRHELTLGQGGPVVEMFAGGDVLLSDSVVEPESISAELSRREDAWKEARDRRGGPSWSAGFGFDRTSAWAEMVSRRAQEAARRAEQRAQAAGRRTEEQIRTAAERHIRESVEREFRGFSNPGYPPPPPPPPPPQPRREKVSEQERLMVLQMLQDKKITVEQAEKLLAALEGRFDE